MDNSLILFSFFGYNMKVNALIVSILALSVSIIIGIINYLYTRRTFKISNYPAIEATLDYSGDTTYGTYISIDMVNLSKNIAISNIMPCLRVYNQAWPMKPWRNKWIAFYSNENKHILAPVTKKDNILNTQTYKSLEDFIHEKMPHIVKKIEVVSQSGIKSQYYKFIKYCEMKILVEIIYSAGIYCSKVLKYKKQYVFIPILQSTDIVSNKLIRWEVKEK